MNEEYETQSVRADLIKYVNAKDLRELNVKVNNHANGKWAIYGPVQRFNDVYVQTMIIPKGTPVTQAVLQMLDED